MSFAPPGRTGPPLPPLPAPALRRLWQRLTKSGWRAAAALALAAVGTLGALQVAAAPAAGTAIGNQASATYTDASSTPRTVTSNVVTAIVQQVASLTLAQSASRTVSVGSQVSYPITLSNSGNGTDTFSLGSSQSGASTAALTNAWPRRSSKVSRNSMA